MRHTNSEELDLLEPPPKLRILSSLKRADSVTESLPQCGDQVSRSDSLEFVHQSLIQCHSLQGLTVAAVYDDSVYSGRRGSPETAPSHRGPFLSRDWSSTEDDNYTAYSPGAEDDYDDAVSPPEPEDDYGDAVSPPEPEDDYGDAVSPPEPEDDYGDGVSPPEPEDDYGDGVSPPEPEDDYDAVSPPEPEDDYGDAVSPPEPEDDYGDAVSPPEPEDDYGDAVSPPEPEDDYDAVSPPEPEDDYDAVSPPEPEDDYGDAVSPPEPEDDYGDGVSPPEPEDDYDDGVSPTRPEDDYYYIGSPTRAVCRSPTDFEQVFDEAMQRGYMEAEIIKVIITGAAGVGKTHLLALLLGLLAPALRVSTGCVEKAIRAMACLKFGGRDGDWIVIDAGMMKTLLANTLPRAHLSIETVEQASKLGQIESVEDKELLADNVSTESNTSVLPEDELAGSKEEEKSSKSPPKHYTETNVNFDSAQILLKCTEIESISDSFQIHEATQLVEKPLQSFKLKDEILKKMRNREMDADLNKMTWLYVVDSGGQPQFHEMFGTFVKNASALISTFKLSEPLDSHPMVEYFDGEGQLCGEPYLFPLTTKEIFENCIQTCHSLPCTIEDGKCPKLITIGTHRDLEDQCTTETRAEKNEKLRNILIPSPELAPESNAVFYGQTGAEVIFPLNCKTPTEEDQKVASELRKAITNLKPPSRPIPYQWLGFELDVEEAAGASGLLSLDNCRPIAQQFFITENSMFAALKYLDELNIFFYHRQALPNVVFSNPNIVLNKITELVEHSYKLRGLVKPSSVAFIDATWLKFCDRGIVTVDFLHDFPRHFVPGLFTATNLLEILDSLFVTAPISNKEHFMPSLLDTLRPENISRPSAKDTSVLCIHFPSGYAPNGLFSSLIAFLLSDENDWPSPWKIAKRPGKLYRSCMMFNLSRKYPTSVTLVDSRSHYEVHVTISGIPELFKNVCPLVHDAILQGLRRVIEERKFRNVQYEVAIPCECDAMKQLQSSIASRVPTEMTSSAPVPGDGSTVLCQRHVATVQLNIRPFWWSCTLTPEVCGQLKDGHLFWFRLDSTATKKTASSSGMCVCVCVCVHAARNAIPYSR